MCEEEPQSLEKGLMLVKDVLDLPNEGTCTPVSGQHRFCVLACHWVNRIVFQGLRKESTVHIKQRYHEVISMGRDKAWGDLLISLIANVVSRCIVNSTVDSSVSLPFFCGPAAIRNTGGICQFLTFLSSSWITLYLGGLAPKASSIT